MIVTTILPNFELRDLGASPFYYEINNTQPARSERGKVYNILKFGVYRAYIERDTAIQRLKNY